MLTTVAGEVALPVTVQVETPDAAAARHRLLPDRGVHHFTAPVDITR